MTDAWSINRRGSSFGPARSRKIAAEVAAFTLLELLVVIGLIVVLLGGVGFALSDRSGASLISAQHSVAALCGAARAQAALHQTEARVLIAADRTASGEPQTYLRLLQVFRAEPAGSDTWIATGTAIFLPRGIYVVPPDLAGLLAPGTEWSSEVRSTLEPIGNPQQPVGTPFGNVAAALMLEFKPDGTPTLPTGQSYARIVLTPAIPDRSLPQFNHPAAVRGILIRPSGALSFVAAASAF